MKRVIVRPLIFASCIVLFVHYFKESVIKSLFSRLLIYHIWLSPAIASTTLLIASIIFIYFSKRSWADFGVRYPKSYSVTTMLFVSIGAATLLSATSFVLAINGYTYGLNAILPFLTIPQMIFFIVIYSPIAEELFFRGFIQHYLSSLSNIKISFFGIYISWATLSTSVLFTLVHWPFVYIVNMYGVAIIFSTCFACGMVAGYYVEKTKSVLPSIIVHMIFNIIAIVEFLFLTRFITIERIF